MFIALVACEYKNNDKNKDQQFETTLENPENIFDSIPLRILINSDKSTDYGITNTNSALFSRLRLLNLDAQISKECEVKFGFPIEFFSFKRAPGQFEINDYRLFFESGEIADLIFPTKINPNYDRHFFWMDEFLDNGYYKDLTPYLSTYCPDVYLNMQRYGFIQEMVTRNDRIYAVYAGVPDISSMALQVKNDLLTTSKKQNIQNFDDLFDFMEAMSQEEVDENNKILVSYQDLLKYAVIKAGYYPLTYRNYTLGYDIVFKVDDPECKPYLIEDTNIFDIFFEDFLPFFEKSYFLNNGRTLGDFVTDHSIDYLSSYINANIRLTNNIFSNTFFNILYNGNTGGHATNDYSMFLFDTESTIVNTVNSILLIPVPYTSTQPEKALSFVNWLFTDEKMVDYLTFGTNIGQFPNYQFNDDGNPVYYQDGCSVYMFHNLIANFSDIYMPFQNKTFDITNEYKRLAQKSIFPPLYRYIESKHSLERYTAYFSILNEKELLEPRYVYLMCAMTELINDPNTDITVDEIKEELRYMTDEDKIITFIRERLQYIVE